MNYVQEPKNPSATTRMLGLYTLHGGACYLPIKPQKRRFLYRNKEEVDLVSQVIRRMLLDDNSESEVGDERKKREIRDL